MKTILATGLAQWVVALTLYGAWLRCCAPMPVNQIFPGKLSGLLRQQFTGIKWALGALIVIDGSLVVSLFVNGTLSVAAIVACIVSAALAICVAVRNAINAFRITRFININEVRQNVVANCVEVESNGKKRPSNLPYYTSRSSNAGQTIDSNVPITIECFESRHDVVHVASVIPIASGSEKLKFQTLNVATAAVIGQDAAIRAIDDDLRLACSGLTKRDDRPLATFLLTGPSGVGKTETAHAIAEVIYGSRDRVAIFSMNEAQGEGGNWRAFGPPPGYKDAGNGGILTNQIKQFSNRCVILIDELEKGPPEVMDALLTGLDTGRFCEALTAERVEIKDCIIVMTSNALTAHDVDESEDQLRQRLLSYRREGQVVIRPEFLGRVKRVLFYQVLDQEALMKICQMRYAQRYANNVRQVIGRNVPQLSDDLARYLVSQLSDSRGGVRSIDGLIEKIVLQAALNAPTDHTPDSDIYRWEYVAANDSGKLQLVRTTAVAIKAEDRSSNSMTTLIG